MGRLTTALSAATASGLIALAVSVAAPAIGDDTSSGNGNAKVVQQDSGRGPLELQSCLQSNGATGVPGDENDGRALKEWIVAHQSDEAARAALTACDVYFGDQKGDPAGDKVNCAGPATGQSDAPKTAAAARARKAGLARRANT